MRKKEDGYYRGSSCKYKLIAHIVFVTKFRYKILYGKLDNDLKKIMLDLANKNDWYIQILETGIDHIHILRPSPNRLNIKHCKNTKATKHL